MDRVTLGGEGGRPPVGDAHGSVHLAHPSHELLVSDGLCLDASFDGEGLLVELFEMLVVGFDAVLLALLYLPPIYWELFFDYLFEHHVAIFALVEAIVLLLL